MQVPGQRAGNAQHRVFYRAVDGASILVPAHFGRQRFVEGSALPCLLAHVILPPRGALCPAVFEMGLMKRWHILLIGLAISAVTLFFALRRANLTNILSAFRTANYGFVALTMVLIVGQVAIRSLRWAVLTQGRLSFIDAFWLWSVGMMFNNVLPARLGEFARAGLTGRRPRMHFSSALSSIVVERLFDMVLVVIMFGVVLTSLEMPDWAKGAGTGMGVVAVLGIVILGYTARRPEGTLKIGARLLALIPTIDEEQAKAFLQPFVEGLGGVSDMRTFILGLGLSIVAWLMSGIAGWILMLAFWPNASVLDGMLAIVGAGLGVAVPAAPSGIGPYEAAIIGLLTAIGYDGDVSRSYAFTMHIAIIVVTGLLGVVGLLREGMSFGEVARAAGRLQEEQKESVPDRREWP